MGVLLGLPPERGFAQASVGEPERLDLWQTLQLGLDRNLNLQQSANDVALRDATLSQERASFSPDLSTAAEQEVRVARAGYYPSVSLSASTGTNYSSLTTSWTSAISSPA